MTRVFLLDPPRRPDKGSGGVRRIQGCWCCWSSSIVFGFYMLICVHSRYEVFQVICFLIFSGRSILDLFLSVHICMKLIWICRRGDGTNRLYVGFVLNMTEVCLKFSEYDRNCFYKIQLDLPKIISSHPSLQYSYIAMLCPVCSKSSYICWI
jgi:hypothetical protein